MNRANRRQTILAFICVILLASCQKQPEEKAKALDPLPSWNTDNTKMGVISFAKAVSSEENSAFVPQEKRTIVFDHDGTLAVEWPVRIEFYFIIDQINKLSKDHPEWQDSPHFKAVLDTDFPRMMAFEAEALGEWQAAIMEDRTVDEYNQLVQNWMKTAKHPIVNRLFTELTYQPMLEAIEWFKSRGFEVYIFTHTDPSFLKNWSKVYQIPKSNIIGFESSEVGDVKQLLDQKPLAVIGNADDDLPMLEWSDSHEVTNFQLFVHHTDSTREWAYDSLSYVGQLKQGFLRGLYGGWLLAKMDRDWKKLYFSNTDSLSYP